MAEHDLQHTPGQPDESGYEKRDVSVAKTLVVGLFVIVLIIGFFIVLNEYFISVSEEITHQQVLAPESKTLREQRARDAELLHSYEVIDSTAGVYRIPIERAMELMANEAFQQKKQ